ncbi:hypothetical protein ES707_14537 [subsurface metagenome]
MSQALVGLNSEGKAFRGLAYHALHGPGFRLAVVAEVELYKRELGSIEGEEFMLWGAGWI